MSRTPQEHEAELVDSVDGHRDRVISYLAALETLSRALGVERTQQIHARAGLLIKSYAETQEGKP